MCCIKDVDIGSWDNMVQQPSWNKVLCTKHFFQASNPLVCCYFLLQPCVKIYISHNNPWHISLEEIFSICCMCMLLSNTCSLNTNVGNSNCNQPCLFQKDIITKKSKWQYCQQGIICPHVHGCQKTDLYTFW